MTSYAVHYGFRDVAPLEREWGRLHPKFTYLEIVEADQPDSDQLRDHVTQLLVVGNGCSPDNINIIYIREIDTQNPRPEPPPVASGRA